MGEQEGRLDVLEVQGKGTEGCELLKGERVESGRARGAEGREWESKRGRGSRVGEQEGQRVESGRARGAEGREWESKRGRGPRVGEQEGQRVESKCCCVSLLCRSAARVQCVEECYSEPMTGMVVVEPAGT